MHTIRSTNRGKVINCALQQTEGQKSLQVQSEPSVRPTETKEESECFCVDSYYLLRRRTPLQPLSLPTVKVLHPLTKETSLHYACYGKIASEPVSFSQFSAPQLADDAISEGGHACSSFHPRPPKSSKLAEQHREQASDSTSKSHCHTQSTCWLIIQPLQCSDPTTVRQWADGFHRDSLLSNWSSDKSSPSPVVCRT